MECPLCLDFYSDNPEDYFVTTKNGHIFHRVCLTLWSESSNSCPTCRECSIQDDDLIRLCNLETRRPEENITKDSTVVESKSTNTPSKVIEISSNSSNYDQLVMKLGEVKLDLSREAIHSPETETPLICPEFQQLYDAIRTGGMLAIDCLITSGAAHINLKDPNTGKTAAHLCVEFRNLEMLEYVYNCGINLNTQDKNGKTPLDLAIESENEIITDFLLNVQETGNVQCHKPQPKIRTTALTNSNGCLPLNTASTVTNNGIEMLVNPVSRPKRVAVHRRKWALVFEEHEPAVKFSKIMMPLEHSYRITLTGKISDQPSQFSINIFEGENIILHFNHVWPECTTTINTLTSQSNTWGKKEHPFFPSLKPSAIFRIGIEFNKANNIFEIQVNNEWTKGFYNRIDSIASMKKVEVTADKQDIQLYKVRLEEYR